MIAEPHRHVQTGTLRELLDDSLSPEQTECVQVHLGSCDHCRDELERIAGEQSWWQETVDVLSQSTLTPPSSQQPTRSRQPGRHVTLDSSVQWIRPLLDDSTASDLGRIDHYPIHGVIGQGGMGVVLKGHDTELNRPVAIKVLAPHLAGVGAARARFMREAQAAAAIVHPSIVPIYSIAADSRLPYIVMPLISGGNLQQRIDRDGPLELAELLRISLQVAEGLQAAHRQGVIHRDIKPANILIEEGNGRVLISDFGLARALSDATLTISGMIAGTPQYMSPEQARGEAVDGRSDLFSMGSLMYALATGRPPFRGESPLAVLRKISDSRPRPILQINEQMPAWLDQIVGELMEIDCSRRTPTAAAAAERIRDVLSHVRNPVDHPLPKSLTSTRPRIVRLVAAGTIAPVAFAAGFLFAETMRTADNATSRNQPPPVTAATIPPSPSATFADSSELHWPDGSLEFELARINERIDSLSQSIEDLEIESESVTEREASRQPQEQDQP
jgi:serine/threonine protein kinase